MEIQPLCPELIAKLEIAVSHRNRERAVAVIERHFDELGAPQKEKMDIPLADLLPMRTASLLARNGFVLVGDLTNVTEAELAKSFGFGQKTLRLLKDTLKRHIDEWPSKSPEIPRTVLNRP